MSGLSDFDRQHLGDLLVDHERYTHYTAHLLRLIAKADYVNRQLLHRVYPAEVEAFEDWQSDAGRTTADARTD